MNGAKPQAAAKETQLPLQVSEDKDGVANEGDQLRVDGDFKIQPGASVTVEDADGTRGTAIDGVDAKIVQGSIDITLMGTPNNVTGGDGVLDTTGTLGLVDTTGIETGLGVAPLAQEDTTGAAGLQVDPLIGAVGGQPNLLTGVVGGKTDPLTGVVGGQIGPLAGVAGNQPKPGAVSGQPGLQPASSAPATGSPSGKGIVSEAMSWLGTLFRLGSDGLREGRHLPAEFARGAIGRGRSPEVRPCPARRHSLLCRARRRTNPRRDIQRRRNYDRRQRCEGYGGHNPHRYRHRLYGLGLPPRHLRAGPGKPRGGGPIRASPFPCARRILCR